MKHKNFVEFKRIDSNKLDAFTIHQTKVALSNFDDKRYILDDGIITLNPIDMIMFPSISTRS